MIVYCVRHAESEANATDVFPHQDTKLTPRGIRQATVIAESLSGLGVGWVYSSPASRTLQTASIIAERLGLEVTVDDRLREADLGSLTGKPYSQVRSQDATWYKEYFTDDNRYGLEKFSSIMQRMKALVDDLYAEHKGSVVLVTHLEPIRALVATALGFYGEWIRKIRINNASITVFLHRDGQLRLQALNWLPLSEYSDGSRL